MEEQGKKLVFLHGECAEALFLERFARCGAGLEEIAAAQPYVLAGYAAGVTGQGRAYLREEPGAEIRGLLCPAGEELLWALDQWKNLSVFIRRSVTGPDGTQLQGYFLNAEAPAPPWEGLEAELERFQAMRAENELGKCDVHLMFPCSFEGFRPPAPAARDGLGARFSEILQDTSAGEFAGDYLCLERGSAGVFTFSAKLWSSQGEPYIQQGLVHYSYHRSALVGTVSVVFPCTSVPAFRILNVFCANQIRAFVDGEFVPVDQWLERSFGLTIYGTARAVLFAHNPLQRDQIVRCLAMEHTPMGKLVGKTLNEYAVDDFAEYDIANVYASHKCMVEIEKTCCGELEERLATQALEIFFVELLQMQTASVRRICRRVLEYMKSDEVRQGVKNYRKLIELSDEMSTAVLFFDYNYFLFPTVSIACQRISERFGMPEEREKYYKYREILDQLIKLAHEQREKIEGDNMNRLLFVLTLVGILPTLAEICLLFLDGGLSNAALLSWGASVAICAALCSIFWWHRRKELRSSSRRKQEGNGST